MFIGTYERILYNSIICIYNNNYNINSSVIKMLSQISQCNQKHVNNGMGVFVIQQKLQLTKVWASDPSCSVKSTSTLTEHKGVVDMMTSSMYKLLVDLINYWVVSNW